MSETITALEWQRRQGSRGSTGYTSCAACGTWKNWTAFLAVVGGRYAVGFACSSDCANELGGSAPIKQIYKTPVAAEATVKIAKAATAPNESRTIMIDVNIRITSEDGTFNGTETNILSALNSTAPVTSAASAPVAKQPAKVTPVAKQPAKVPPATKEAPLKAVPDPVEEEESNEQAPTPAPARRGPGRPKVEKDTPEQVSEDSANLDDAVVKATEMLGSGKAAAVKAALKDVGAARVSQLKPSQVQPFLDALADA